MNYGHYLHFYFSTPDFANKMMQAHIKKTFTKKKKLVTIANTATD